jgi:hypothetical protein
MAEPTRYQSVVSPTSYDTAGFVWKAVFNGMNQWLTHAALDMTSTDEVTLWVSLLKESDAATVMAYELSANSNSNNGTVYLTAPTIVAGNPYNFQSGGTTRSLVPSISLPAPSKSTLVGRAKINSSILNMTQMGSQVVTSSASQGTGNYGNHVGFIGARAGTSLFFRGELYELGIAGKAITDGQLQSLNNRMTRSAKI